MKIDLLANHRHFITQIARWCCDEWPWYYQDGDYSVAENYHRSTAQKNSIPITLVAMDENNKLIGTVAILEEDLELRPNLSPWLGCLYVLPENRGVGIANKLIDEGVLLAASLGLTQLYAWTATLSELFRSKDWTYSEKLRYQQLEIEIFHCNPKSIYSTCE